MAEYIKLEPLRDEILNDTDPAYDSDTINHFLGIVDSQPVVDVVEVVRCKDCEHRKEVPDCQKELYSSSCVACSYHSGLIMDGNDFCSYGEKKEGAEE